MTTIEEIFEKNDRESSLHANIIYKELITPAIMNFIIYSNNQFQTAQDNSGFNGLIKHLKLVISGGAAFDYYIKRTGKTDVINTHDFDLRLYLDIPPSKSPLFSKNRQNSRRVEEWMLKICKELGNLFTEFLNNYVASSNIVQVLDNRNIEISQFIAGDRGFLTTIEYKIKDWGTGEDELLDSIVDIVPHVPSKAIHYGPLTSNKEQNFANYNEADFSGVTSRHGFFKSSLVYSKTEYGVYYVSLGFLVWDTVRMINYIIDAKYFGTKRNVDPTIKFERYLEKYKVLLSALSRPELYLRCEAFSKFIGKCNRVKKICQVDGEKISTKSDLVYKGVEKGIFPNDIYWYKELLKMDFSDLCNTVLQ